MSESASNRHVVGRVPSRGKTIGPPANAASGDAACNAGHPASVGRLPSTGVSAPPGVLPNEPTPRRLRRVDRVWPDRDGNISYLLTMCVDGRSPVLDNEDPFQRLTAFLLDSPTRYHWLGRRFVVMPDHIHLIAQMGHDAVGLGQWIKALKAVVGGLKRRDPTDAASGSAACSAANPADVGRVPPHGLPEFSRIKRSWRWQDGFHDHKFRTPESEFRKWEYVCLNPVRYGLIKRPEDWPYGGEIFYEDTGGPRLVRGTPPLLETGRLIEEETPRQEGETLLAPTRPAT